MTFEIRDKKTGETYRLTASDITAAFRAMGKNVDSHHVMLSIVFRYTWDVV